MRSNGPAIQVAPPRLFTGHGAMGTKYQPSTKDSKAILRFQQNARRAEANGAVRKSIYITAEPPPRITEPPAAPRRPGGAG